MVPPNTLVRRTRTPAAQGDGLTAEIQVIEQYVAVEARNVEPTKSMLGLSDRVVTAPPTSRARRRSMSRPGFDCVPSNAQPTMAQVKPVLARPHMVAMTVAATAVALTLRTGRITVELMVAGNTDAEGIGDDNRRIPHPGLTQFMIFLKNKIVLFYLFYLFILYII